GQTAFLKGLGAEVVINYRDRKISTLSDRYDVIFDLTTSVKFSEVKSLLKPKGIFIPADPFAQLLSILGNVLRKKKVGYLMVDKGDNDRLTRIAQWVEQGQLKPIIDSIYSFKDYEKGLKRTLEPGKRGRIIIQIEEG
ncbi:MAG: zinc-binding dehydrogenase, partial [Bacteroidota bacterium]